MKNNNNSIVKKLPGKSYKKIAEETGMSISTVIAVLKGRRNITAENMIIIEKALEIIKKTEELKKAMKCKK